MEKGTKSEAAARRCAKAALLLHSLKNSTNSENEEKWKKEMEYLKIELVKERSLRKKIKLCAFTEILVQLLLLLSIWTFFLVLLICYV